MAKDIGGFSDPTSPGDDWSGGAEHADGSDRWKLVEALPTIIKGREGKSAHLIILSTLAEILRLIPKDQWTSEQIVEQVRNGMEKSGLYNDVDSKGASAAIKLFGTKAVGQ